MRDKLGRFIHGHKPIPHWDPTMGRFISEFKMGEEVVMVEEKVDRILREKRFNATVHPFYL